MDSEMDAHRPANTTRALTVRSKAVAVIDPRRELAKPEKSGRAVARSLGQAPLLVVGMGAKASERFVTFFTDNIRNPHTRRAYHRWVCDFFEWCEVGGLDFTTIKSYHVARYVEELTAGTRVNPKTGRKYAKSSIKQALAAIRMLYDWLIVGQVCEINPAHAVRGPKLVVDKGKTPVLDDEEVVELYRAIDKSHVVGLRDRALISLMLFTFSRVGAGIEMDVLDYFGYRPDPCKNTP